MQQEDYSLPVFESQIVIFEQITRPDVWHFKLIGSSWTDILFKCELCKKTHNRNNTEGHEFIPKLNPLFYYGTHPYKPIYFRATNYPAFLLFWIKDDVSCDIKRKIIRILSYLSFLPVRVGKSKRGIYMPGDILTVETKYHDTLRDLVLR